MAHLLIIELPGGNDTDVIEAAVARGHDFTFLSADLAHYERQSQVMAMLSLARERIECRPFDYEVVECSVLEMHAACPIDAVLCLVDIRLSEAARLSHRLGVRYLNPGSAALLRDKYRVRCRLAEAGLAQPEFALAVSNDAVKQAVERLGLPVLIKPSDGYGSQNIVLLRHAMDLDPLMTPLDDLLPCRADYGLGARANDRLIVERHLLGTIIGCDTLTLNGEHRLIGIHEKVFFDSPSFAIRGGCFTPANLVPEGLWTTMDRIERYVSSALDAVGFDWGAAHTELILTAEGPQLIEINPRLVGAKIGRLVSLALGCSIHEALIELHLGDSNSLLPASGRLVGVSRWIVAAEIGVLDRVEVPRRRDSRIRCVEIVKARGDLVRPPLENADRLGYVMACATSRVEAVHVAETFVSRCKCHLKAISPPIASPDTNEFVRASVALTC